MHRIKRGLDLPILGEPDQSTIGDAPSPSRVALLADDYVGLRTRLEVEPGDHVLRGQALFADKRALEMTYTAPAAGRVVAINRGAKRAVRSLVIELSEAEQAGEGRDEQISFFSFTGRPPAELSADEIRALLVESGMWAAFRTRPYSKVPRCVTHPEAIFVTAMDSHPLAPSLERVLADRGEDLETGLACISRLGKGKTYLCVAAGSPLTAHAVDGVTVAEFTGPHPAGTVGVHIHLLEPVHRVKTVWHIGAQDVAAIGRLMRSGELEVERVISLCGPGVLRPRLIRTRLGVATDELVRGEVKEGEQRIVSGSVLGGRSAHGEVEGYLGRYHQQVTVLSEGRKRELLGWLRPGRDIYSVTGAFLSWFRRGHRFDFTTTTHGSPRPLVPIGTYEEVMPMDVQATYLIRALVSGDFQRAEALGALELDEEDLALCTFVCPSKFEYGPLLRDALTEIEREG